jgi:hypothetical protein
MIPPYGSSGALPPYVGTSPAVAGGMSPYGATILEVATRFCTSAERVALFQGLLQFRASLVGAGLTVGVQWLDGSFCEDVESTRGRPPADIDVVTFFQRPAHVTAAADWATFVMANGALLTPSMIKPAFGCDGGFVDVSLGPQSVIPQTAYWFGLFTHQRSSFAWKGIVMVPLVDNDAAAAAFAANLPFP